MFRIIRNHEDTRVSDTRFLQVGSHSRHLHLNGLSWLNLTLLQIHLQAHRKHLHAADIQFRLTLIGNQNLTLQLLLSIETTQIEIGGRHLYLRSQCLLGWSHVLETRKKNG